MSTVHRIRRVLQDGPRSRSAALFAGLGRNLSRRGPSRVDTQMWNMVRRVRDHDFSAHSDRGLREAIESVRGRLRPAEGDEAVAQLFALVDEAISRRMGTWRLFDPDFEKGGMSRYEDLARRILESGPHRDRIAFYTDPAFMDGESLRRSIAPMLAQMGLDEDEQTIVWAIVYVAEKSKLDYPSNILLPAEFYRAVAAKDVDGVLRFRPSDEQLAVGVLMCRRVVVEMNAGEGKTVAAAFPAILHALRGDSVHIITANDYLAGRDADSLAPVCESLGLTVGAVLGYMEDEERRHEYGRQIVYGTLREFGFDFLRDNLKLPPDEQVQGSLDVAIVDEADHALIDQARTPLIISGEPAGSRRAFERTRRAVEVVVSVQAAAVQELEGRLARGQSDPDKLNTLLAELLMADPDSDILTRRLAEDPRAYRRVLAMVDDEVFQDSEAKLSRDLLYTVDASRRSVTLTDRGQRLIEKRVGPIFDTSTLRLKLASAVADADSPLEEWRRRIRRLQRRIFRQSNRVNQVYQMLRAHALLKRDEDYVVSGDDIVLVDAFTGRTLPDNRYQQGLHAALEAKEGLLIHPESETLAQVSVQGFLGHYSRIAGMTGTALDSREELEREYGLRVASVPTSQPCQRVDSPTRLYLTRRDKLEAIVDEVKSRQRVGRPVLVGTLSIEQSEEISRLFSKRGIRHSLLNAVRSESEAEIVRNAGAFGAVTISTNMAGRGTDILLEPGLDDRVTRCCVSLVDELLSDGLSHVELACGTGREADLLWRALSDREGFRLSRNASAVDPGGPVIVASSKSGVEPGTRSVRLEFGLGLYVLGTEMNQAARIDRQLRGRSGRQGAFGASRFILSLEDSFLALRGDNASCMSDGQRVDRHGRAFFEGPKLTQHLNSVQDGMEDDDEAGRSMSNQFDRVLGAQTVAYYQARREIIETDSFHAACRGFVEQWTARLVDRYLPESWLPHYSSQFDRLAEELRVDYGIDCSGLRGVGIDEFPGEVGRLVLARLEEARERVGRLRFGRLEKLLFLYTADELWRDQLAELQEWMLSVPLAHQSYKAAVAEYAIRTFKAYEPLKQQVVDAFLLRLLTFPVDGTVEDQGQEIDLVEDLAEILV